jgi:hypothetical protein
MNRAPGALLSTHPGGQVDDEDASLVWKPLAHNWAHATATFELGPGGERPAALALEPCRTATSNLQALPSADLYRIFTAEASFARS